MLQSFLEQKPIILALRCEIEIDFPNSNEWIVINQLNLLFQPFEQITKELEGDNSTLSVILPIIELLKIKFSKMVAEEHQVIPNMRLMVLDELERRFKGCELISLYCLSTLLDP